MTFAFEFNHVLNEADVNNLENVSKKIKEATVYFESNCGTPCIQVSFAHAPGYKIQLARYVPHKFKDTCTPNWWKNQACPHPHDTTKSYLFEYLTPSAQRMVEGWINELVHKYNEHLKNS